MINMNYMNIFSGTVQTRQEWIEEYKSLGMEKFSDEDFQVRDSYGVKILVEVEKDENGNWVEVE